MNVMLTAVHTPTNITNARSPQTSKNLLDCTPFDITVVCNFKR